MDKELPIESIAAVTLVASIILFLTARHAPKLVVVPALAVGLFFILHLTEIADPFVGLAIRQEAGTIYVLASWFSPLIPVLATITGALARRRARGGA